MLYQQPCFQQLRKLEFHCTGPNSLLHSIVLFHKHMQIIDFCYGGMTEIKLSQTML